MTPLHFGHKQMQHLITFHYSMQSPNIFFINHRQQMKTPIILLLAALQLSLSAADDSGLYKLVLTSQQRGAACLDGTAPGFYVHEGIGDNRRNFLIYFEGGGYCGKSTLSDTLESCYQRSKSALGSTAKAAGTLDLNGYGILSPSQKDNFAFYDWTKIAVIYCDGHEFVGNRLNPIAYKDTKLYFRGSKNVKQIFNTLHQMYDWYNGGKILISGGSAGGMATYEWSNYLVQNTKKAQVFAAPDSGLFITDYTSPVYNVKVLRANVQPLMSLVNDPSQMPKPILQCQKQQGFDIVDCLNAGNYAKYLTANLFLIQSPYDEYSLRNIVNIKCFKNSDSPYSLESCNQTEIKYIEDYRYALTNEIKAMRGDRKNFGVWAPSCVQHSFVHTPAFNSQDYTINGRTIMQALDNFVSNPSQAEWLLDEVKWPNNKGCNGLSHFGRKELQLQKQ